MNDENNYLFQHKTELSITYLMFPDGLIYLSVVSYNKDLDYTNL